MKPSVPDAHFWPYVFAGSYVRTRSPGAIAAWSFTELEHWSLHYAEGSAPPTHGPFWGFRPCAYRYLSDGAYYDYVLVQGAHQVFEDAPGPPFVRVASSGVFTLYARAAGAPSVAGEADVGPCDARVRSGNLAHR